MPPTVAPVDQDPSVLSLRELEVFIGLARGFNLREIAELIGISVKTVDKHRMKAIRKLKVRNNSDLVRLAIKHGVIDVDGDVLTPKTPLLPVAPISQPRAAIAQAEKSH